ncbi:MAG: 2Fe-2S iron-sulfur cluster-binding protein [Paracoccaceae bacterium]|nr:2Fe-2S iron-sulfur cluster-binding protein [Paracoccaceae bacterium]
MARIRFAQADGSEITLESFGGSLMEAARAAGVRGIEGQCGGVASCGTCHVYVDAAWLEAVGPASAAELDMLEFEPATTHASRLSCQIAVTSALDGLKVTVANG